MNSIYLLGNPLYQWDSDRSIEVFPPDPRCSIDEVHACSVGGTGAYNLVMVRADDKVTCEIPNILLQDAASIRVFGVMHTFGGRRTIIERTFCVTPRPKPDDYVYTETEVKTFNALDERIKTLEQGGGSGEPGEDGGYYIPNVSQVDENTMNVAFTASKEGMPTIEEQQITLPSGKDAPQEAVLYTPQELSPEQQAQARENISSNQIFHFTFEVEGAVKEAVIPLPIDLHKAVIFNIHGKYPNVETEFMVKATFGGVWEEIGKIPACTMSNGESGSNLYALRQMDNYYMVNRTVAPNYHYNARCTATYNSMRIPQGTTSIKLYNQTDDTTIPAGTTFEIWGVYHQ